MNVLGIDYGLKRVGLALAVNKTIVPLETLVNDNSIYDLIKKIIIKKKIKKIIVGNPVLLSGKKGSSVKLVKKFIKKLSDISGVPIELFDERFTSKIATSKLSYLNSKKQKNYIDQISAVEILKSAI
jgi:putative Holliday junction resolvase